MKRLKKETTASVLNLCLLDGFLVIIQEWRISKFAAFFVKEKAKNKHHCYRIYTEEKSIIVLCICL